MGVTRQAVYERLRERMADEFDQPTDDDIIDIILELAVEAVDVLPVHLVDVRFDMDDEPDYRKTVELAAVIAAIQGPDQCRQCGRPIDTDNDTYATRLVEPAALYCSGVCATKEKTK